MLRRDGSRFPVEVRGRLLTFRNEVVRIAAVRDITEKKQREAQLHDQAEQLRALSLRDELTGLYNRRGFMELAQLQLLAAQRCEGPCAVFFADLNGMKLINDQLGHEMGDHAIRAASQVLSKVFGAADVLARLGGDEFAVFVSDCDEERARELIPRIDRSVADANGVSTARYRLSISAGFAAWSAANPRDLDGLMKLADANMYHAKKERHGRASLRVLTV